MNIGVIVVAQDGKDADVAFNAQNAFHSFGKGGAQAIEGFVRATTRQAHEDRLTADVLRTWSDEMGGMIRVSTPRTLTSEMPLPNLVTSLLRDYVH